MAKSVRGEILQLEREQVRAINRGDVRGALKLFDRGFVGFSSTKHERIRGLGALRKTFDYYLKQAPKLAYHGAAARVGERRDGGGDILLERGARGRAQDPRAGQACVCKTGDGMESGARAFFAGALRRAGRPWGAK